MSALRVNSGTVSDAERGSRDRCSYQRPARRGRKAAHDALTLKTLRAEQVARARDCPEQQSVFRFGADNCERDGPSFRAKGSTLREMIAFRKALVFHGFSYRGIQSRS